MIEKLINQSAIAQILEYFSVFIISVFLASSAKKRNGYTRNCKACNWVSLGQVFLDLVRFLELIKSFSI
jgi:hypothetical protein